MNNNSAAVLVLGGSGRSGSLVAEGVGEGATPTGDIERILGRPATSLETFARRNANAWITGTTEVRR